MLQQFHSPDRNGILFNKVFRPLKTVSLIKKIQWIAGIAPKSIDIYLNAGFELL